jgi:hypothetical protein
MSVLIVLLIIPWALLVKRLTEVYRISLPRQPFGGSAVDSRQHWVGGMGRANGCSSMRETVFPAGVMG